MAMIVPHKYLSEFYTYKPSSLIDKVKTDENYHEIEKQIQAHILAGNEAFFGHKYNRALNQYLSAWGLIPRICDPLFPTVVGVLDDLLLLKVA